MSDSNNVVAPTISPIQGFTKDTLLCYFATAIAAISVLYMALWDIGKPMPWNDEAATIMVGRTISPQTFFLPSTSRANSMGWYLEYYPSDREIKAGVTLPSGTSIGGHYIVAVSELFSKSPGLARFLFTGFNLGGIFLLAISLKLLLPNRYAPVLFFVLVLFSGYLFPYLRTMRSWSQATISLGVVTLGMTLLHRGFPRLGGKVLAASLCVTWFFFYPVLPGVIVGSACFVVYLTFSSSSSDRRQLLRHLVFPYLVSIGICASLILVFNNVGGTLFISTGPDDATTTYGNLSTQESPYFLDFISQVLSGVPKRLLYLANSYMKLTHLVYLTAALVSIFLVRTLLSAFHKTMSVARFKALKCFLLTYRQDFALVVSFAVIVVFSVLIYSLGPTLTNIRYSVGLHLHVLFLMTYLTYGGVGLIRLVHPLVTVRQVMLIFVAILAMKEMYYVVAMDQRHKSSIYQIASHVEFLNAPYVGPIDRLCSFLDSRFGDHIHGVAIVISYEYESLEVCLQSDHVYSLERWLSFGVGGLPEVIIPRPDLPLFDPVHVTSFQGNEASMAAVFPIHDEYTMMSIPVRDIGFNNGAISRPGYSPELLLDCSSEPDLCTRIYVLTSELH